MGIGSNGAAIPKKSLWVRVKKELVHYWHGTKLLGTEIKISTKLANRLFHGSKLTRREQRQVTLLCLFISLANSFIDGQHERLDE